MVDDLPMDTSQLLFHFNEDLLAYAGRYRHDEDVHLHCHSFVEIAFVIGGRAVHRSRTGDMAVAPGDVILLRPGVWHGYQECAGLTLFNCCFSSELMRDELAWTREDPMLGYLLWTGPYSAAGHGILTLRLNAGPLNECRFHLDALAATRHCPAGPYRGDIVGRLACLFSALGRAAAGSRAATYPAETSSPAVGQAIRLLEDKLADSWTVGSLADELHLAPGYLARLFKDATGLPPMAYLARLRAEQAAGLLLHSQHPVASIGRAVGWPDQNYFARRFRAHFGLSPSTYRTRFSASVGGDP